uniref:MARVEL domain-containing protein n=1 Tax=Dendroctonus ponderosae TaxID=77166 RepID=A0AAR5PLN1_DENPD
MKLPGQMKMTILHSCCCWNSVRKGSLACGVYTGIYYTLNAAQSSFLLHEEVSFLKNASNQSLIDHDITSETSAVFSALIFAFSSCGIITTLLLFIGIIKDIKFLLIPWIFNMAFFTIVDVIYIIYGLIVHALQWNPSVAILVTTDFFLNTLNVPNIQYSTTQPTATSYLSSHNRKPLMYLEKATPTHSPTSFGPNILDGPPSLGNRGPRKSVKFGDSSEMSMVAPPAWSESKLSPTKGADTAPLIDSGPDGGGTVNV